eukprot:TRINITY_DN30987_c4_g1_i1.p1 TRINITY_DN30987_c4_g1~~TRINITY_DN30987_c4_g1_i1.p1  ORF type:complete len:516 (+),score=168.72 TRINITY_DN30987_c4_g1_i1:75-1550(+)
MVKPGGPRRGGGGGGGGRGRGGFSKHKPKKKGRDWKARLSSLFQGDDTPVVSRPPAHDEDDAPPAAGGGRKRPRHSGDEEDAEGAEERRKQLFDSESKEGQLFVSNIPFDATEEEISERFGAYGRVRRVLLLRDRATGHPSGSAFVHYKNAAGARKALAEAERNMELLGVGRDGAAAAPGSKAQMKRMRRKVSGAGSSDGIALRGRVLRVRPAVRREEAEGLTRQAERARQQQEHADPRNLRLAEEGRIVRDTPAAAGLSEQRIELLAGRHRNKLRQLRDPNYFVSATRLCVRDLPQEVDEKELKRLVMIGVKDFTATHPDFLGEGGKGAKEGEGGHKNPFIKQLRLMRDPAGKSRGFGFAELRQHELALAVLRRLNNNPTLFGARSRLHVEFAVESVHALRRLQRITDKGRRKHQEMSRLAKAGTANPREEWRRQRDEAAAASAAASAAAAPEAGQPPGEGRKRPRTPPPAAAGGNAKRRKKRKGGRKTG